MSNKILKKNIEANIPTYHEWGDEWEYWNMLYTAIDECSEVFRKARIFVYDKEKYGTYRCTILSMWDGTIRGLLNEYRMYNEFNWYNRLDRWFARILIKIGFVKFINKKQVEYVNREMQKIYLEYPEIVNEFISDVDFYEWIKPCKQGIVDGSFIHDKYWETL